MEIFFFHFFHSLSRFVGSPVLGAEERKKKFTFRLDRDGEQLEVINKLGPLMWKEYHVCLYGLGGQSLHSLPVGLLIDLQGCTEAD